jgi:hypothetical protein
MVSAYRLASAHSLGPIIGARGDVVLAGTSPDSRVPLWTLTIGFDAVPLGCVRRESARRRDAPRHPRVLSKVTASDAV